MNDPLIIKVNPIIVYPECITNYNEQDCFNCEQLGICNSPRSWCVKPYYNHPKGCPNYGVCDGCPPNVPMIDQVFNIDEEIYLVITEFDLKTHMNILEKKHPDWNYYQLANLRYWQAKSINTNNYEVAKFLNNNPDLVSTNWIESMGVDLIQTLEQYDIDLSFGKELFFPKRITLVGNIYRDALDIYGLDIETFKVRDLYSRKLTIKK